MKKLLSSLIFSTMFAITTINATIADTISKGASGFGDFYTALTGNSNIIDGIAVILFGIGLAAMVYWATGRFIKKDMGEGGHNGARKGIALIFSIMVTGALVRASPSDLGFVGFIGGTMTFLMLCAIIVFSYIAYCKWIKDKVAPNNTFFRVGLWAFGIVFIDITLTSLSKNLFQLGPANTTFVGKIISFVNELGAWAVFIAIMAFFIGLLAWIFMSGRKDRDPEEAEDEKRRKRNDKLGVERLKKQVASFESRFQQLDKNFNAYWSRNNLSGTTLSGLSSRAETIKGELENIRGDIQLIEKTEVQQLSRLREFGIFKGQTYNTYASIHGVEQELIGRIDALIKEIEDMMNNINTIINTDRNKASENAAKFSTTTQRVNSIVKAWEGIRTIVYNYKKIELNNSRYLEDKDRLLTRFSQIVDNSKRISWGVSADYYKFLNATILPHITDETQKSKGDIPKLIASYEAMTTFFIMLFNSIRKSEIVSGRVTADEFVNFVKVYYSGGNRGGTDVNSHTRSFITDFNYKYGTSIRNLPELVTYLKTP